MRIIDVLNPHNFFRDAGSGKFVSRTYAILHPKTTVKENVSVPSERLDYLESLTLDLRDVATAKGYDTIAAAVEAAPARQDGK